MWTNQTSFKSFCRRLIFSAVFMQNSTLISVFSQICIKSQLSTVVASFPVEFLCIINDTKLMLNTYQKHHGLKNFHRQFLREICVIYLFEISIQYQENDGKYCQFRKGSSHCVEIGTLTFFGQYPHENPPLRMQTKVLHTAWIWI